MYICLHEEVDKIITPSHTTVVMAMEDKLTWTSYHIDISSQELFQ